MVNMGDVFLVLRKVSFLQHFCLWCFSIAPGFLFIVPGFVFIAPGFIYITRLEPWSFSIAVHFAVVAPGEHHGGTLPSFCKRKNGLF